MDELVEALRDIYCNTVDWRWRDCDGLRRDIERIQELAESALRDYPEGNDPDEEDGHD